jgi:hypothetical protein
MNNNMTNPIENPARPAYFPRTSNSWDPAFRSPPMPPGFSFSSELYYI